MIVQTIKYEKLMSQEYLNFLLSKISNEYDLDRFFSHDDLEDLK